MDGCGGGYRPRRPEEGVLYRAVREGWPQVLAEASGLPRRLEEEVRRYLRCGVLRYGFVQVKCPECQRSVLVGLSCKGRALCPSCNARRAHLAALHCGEVLPEVAYRQWTLSLPRAWRWAAVKTPGRLRLVERRLVQAIHRWQRRRARELGATGKLHGGGVCFVQLFGSALQLTPHLHLLQPEGLWDEAGRFVPLPPPRKEELEAILLRLLRLLGRSFHEAEESWPEDGLERLQAEAVQYRLPLPMEAPRPMHRRELLAVGSGFSLHASTFVHAHDRQGLRHLCGYGSRGPLAEERLSRREDGLYVYRCKRGSPLVLTAAQLVKRLLALAPPKGMHLTNFHGVLAANSRLRPLVVRHQLERDEPPREEALTAAGADPGSAPSAFASGLPRRPRIDWATLQRKTFGDDVWACPCGGRRRVLAVLTRQQTAEEVLRNMGLAHLCTGPPRPRAQAPPQLRLAV